MESFEEDLATILEYALAYHEKSGNYVAVIHPNELRKILINLLQRAIDAEKDAQFAREQGKKYDALLENEDDNVY